MTEGNQAAADVAKSRKGLTAALLAILLVIAAMVGAAYAMGVWPFETASEEPEVVVPGNESQEQTETAEATPTPSVTLPSTDAQEVMYWEQVASAEQIADMVADKFATFELSQIAETAETATIRVKATYRDGSALNGQLLLRKYSDAWYFAMITRDGNPATTPVTGATDMAVAKAITEGNAANQEIPAAILTGGYTTITIDKVTAGSGTAMIDATFSGGSAPATKGQITCISKEAGGEMKWFITGFVKS